MLIAVNRWQMETTAVVTEEKRSTVGRLSLGAYRRYVMLQ